MAYGSFPNLDLNAVGAYTDYIVLSEETTASAQLVVTSPGVIGLTAVTIEGSLDGANWVSTGVIMTSVSITASIDVKVYKFLRGQVTTASGAAAMGTLTLLAKRN